MNAAPNSENQNLLSPAPATNKAELDEYLKSLLAAPPVEPWSEPVDGAPLLDEILNIVCRFVVLPKWVPETVTLFVPHTFAYQYRDVTTYLGIESPEHRCGKSTLITVLSELTHRAVVASNVTAPSFFRVIARLQPTLLIDEADTFLKGNDELKGILNSSYFRKTSFVLRAVNLPTQANGSQSSDRETPADSEPSLATFGAGIARYSCWCPKCIARIGALPPTLADRCIVFRMHRKLPDEKCERLRKFHAGDIKRKCLRFVLDHAAEIASAEPALPPELNDRAADIWEPLFVIADLAGGPWPTRARQAAIALSTSAADSNFISTLIFDVLMQFALAETDRMFSFDLVNRLNNYGPRPWKDLRNGKPIDDRWLARQLSPYGVRPRNIRINDQQAKGYLRDEISNLCRRYVSRSEARALLDEFGTVEDEPSTGKSSNQPPQPPTGNGQPPPANASTMNIMNV